jgi:hypothetical protein
MNSQKMNLKFETSILLNTIIEWLNDNNIGNSNKNKMNIAREIFWVIIANDMENDIQHIKHQITTKEFVFTEGNVWDSILTYFDGNHRYLQFCKDVSELTPSGLNTSPNACCGKFELLYRLLRPVSIQPQRGDILDNGVKIEIKGKTGDDGGVRISSTELTGKTYKTNNDSVFKDTSIKPNNVKTGGLKNTTVYEIEKTQYKEHYKREFDRDIHLSKELIKGFLTINGWSFIDSDIEQIFTNNEWNQDELQRFILKKLFFEYKTKNGFDKMIIFGDGTNVKVLYSEQDLNKITIVSDYFRINQTANIGWYIV